MDIQFDIISMRKKKRKISIQFTQTSVHDLLSLVELLLPPQLLHLLDFLSVLLLHQLPVRLHAAITLADESHELSHELVALLTGFLSGLLVLLLHGPFLPAVGGLPRVILLFPGKVFTSAEALPVAVKHVHYL